MLLYIGCNGFVSGLDPRSGNEIWRTPLGKGLFGGSTHQDVCVLEHQGIVYAGSFGVLHALDGRSGEILWSNELKGMGYNDVTLSIAGKSVQFVSSEEDSPSKS